MMMEVSIIIVNYHSVELVISCIDSIYQKTKDIIYEIIVVDNASKDGSIERLQDIYGKKIKIIEAEENLGFGKANNLGVKFAEGEFIFLLNPDTILINNAIKILRDSLLENKQFGSVGGNLYTKDITPCPSYCLSFDDINSEKKYSSWVYIVSSKIKQKLGMNKERVFGDCFNYSNNPISVAYVFGADMMMKKEIFEMLGGFDPKFFMYAEEQELSWRILKLGKGNFNIPSAKIIHLEGATIKKDNAFNEKQFKMRMIGTMTLFEKNFGIDGVKEFFRFRSRRYKRLIFLARIQKKTLEDIPANIQLKCLEECYNYFNNNININ